MRKVKAPGYRVLVRLKPTEKTKEEVSEGGIIIELKDNKDLELEQQGMREAHIIDIGSSAFKMRSTGDSTPWCEVGDCVLIHKHSGTLLDNMEDSYTYRMVLDMDIEAVFPNEKINLLGGE